MKWITCTNIFQAISYQNAIEEIGGTAIIHNLGLTVRLGYKLPIGYTLKKG